MRLTKTGLVGALGAAMLGCSAMGQVISMKVAKGPQGFSIIGRGGHEEVVITGGIELTGSDINGVGEFRRIANSFGSLTLAPGQSTEVSEGVFEHRYQLSGLLQVLDPSNGESLLDIYLVSAELIAIGTADRWGSSVQIVGLDPSGTIVDWLGGAEPDVGLPGSTRLEVVEAFQLTIEGIFGPPQGGPSGVQLDSIDRLPEGKWISTSASFSFVGAVVPAGPSAAVLLVGLGVSSRRQRRERVVG